MSNGFRVRVRVIIFIHFRSPNSIFFFCPNPLFSPQRIPSPQFLHFYVKENLDFYLFFSRSERTLLPLAGACHFVRSGGGSYFNIFIPRYPNFPPLIYPHWFVWQCILFGSSGLSELGVVWAICCNSIIIRKILRWRRDTPSSCVQPNWRTKNLSFFIKFLVIPRIWFWQKALPHTQDELRYHPLHVCRPLA